MEFEVKHVVELSPETLAVLKGFVSAVRSGVEAQSSIVEKPCQCSQKDEAGTADTKPEPVKKARKPRAKKQEEVVAQAATLAVPAEEVAEEPLYTSEQVHTIALKGYGILEQDKEAKVGGIALVKKMRQLVLGEDKANDPECHETATIEMLNPEQREEFVSYCLSEEVGSAAIVELVDSVMLGRA